MSKREIKYIFKNDEIFISKESILEMFSTCIKELEDSSGPEIDFKESITAIMGAKEVFQRELDGILIEKMLEKI